MFLRNIKDIRISNNTISVTRKANLSLKELEDQIKKLEFQASKDFKSKVTENAKLPPFIQSFFYLFFSNLKIPTEKEFVDTYLKWAGIINGDKVIIENKTYPLAGIKARMNRTYPSIIRDLHFLYLLENSKLFDEVDYSMERDYLNGLDLKINYKKQTYYVSLLIDTNRANYFKKKKIERHDYSVINEIVFNVSFDSLSRIGNIYLLNQKHIKLLLERINQN